MERADEEDNECKRLFVVENSLKALLRHTVDDSTEMHDPHYKLGAVIRKEH